MSAPPGYVLRTAVLGRFSMEADPAVVRDTIGTGIYFITYESAKQLLANARGNSPTTPLAVVVAGGLCGLVSWACVCSRCLVSTLLWY